MNPVENPLLAVATGVVFPSALAIGIVLLLREPLLNLLIELCGNPARARFWAMFSILFTVLCTLFGVLAFLPLSGDAFADHATMVLTLTTIRAGVLGLLLSLAAIAALLLSAIGKYEEAAARRNPQTVSGPLADRP